ncbi:MAG TPA: hypothetical protein VGH99_16460 [Pseudonocardia sp.]
MISAAAVGIGLVAIGLVLTPGPNMLYLVSRSITQGRRPGLVSLLGVAAGFGVYLAARCARAGPPCSRPGRRRPTGPGGCSRWASSPIC